ncbi:MAG: DNA-3-methyladenine glycosylase family protein [Alphaproteobacteria bacterium]|jgi:DNA-3-methyladenine glycosylase II
MALGSEAFAAEWARGCVELACRDGVMHQLIARYPDERLEPHGDVFLTLVRAVVGQQISVLAAERIWSRVVALLGSVRPERIAESDHDVLQGCGLTARKTSYLEGLADHVVAHPDAWGRLPVLDDAALEHALTELRGVGPWTAQMAMIFALGRLDVLPAADIGLQRVVADRYGIPRSAESLLELSESWRPWRTLAVWYLWRDLDPIPVAY